MIQSPAGYQGDVRVKRYLDFYQAGYGVAMLSSGVAFSPLSLFAQGEQGGWYDPSDFSTLFQDSAGTTPVTAVEQPVGRVLDKSGRGNHLSQSTSTARPVLKQDANGCYYLLFDGTDDFLVSGTINPGSVDKAQVFAGVRKLSDASAQMFCEYSASIGSNTGSLVLNQGDYTTGLGAYWIHGARGAATLASNQFATTPANYAAPITSVLTGYSDIAGDLSVIRVNGAEQATATGDKGSGNWGSYPLYIGRRGGTSQPFNGQLYSLILRFSATNMDAATIASTETWVNQKTLAY